MAPPGAAASAARERAAKSEQPEIITEEVGDDDDDDNALPNSKADEPSEAVGGTVESPRPVPWSMAASWGGGNRPASTGVVEGCFGRKKAEDD